MIEEDLFDYLVSNVASASAVYKKKLPQKPDFPCLTYFEVSRMPDNTHDGFSHYTTRRYQVSSWAKGAKSGGTDSAGAKTLADEVQAALNAFRGLMGATQIYSCLCVGGGQDIYDAEPDVWQVPLDFMIAFRE